MSTKQDHKRWRKQFNEDCLKRDKYKCKFCDITENLDVHHIVNRHELPNGGYVPSNGITLCENHHMMAEEFHVAFINNIDKEPNGFSPSELYDVINSSYGIALSDSENLK